MGHCRTRAFLKRLDTIWQVLGIVFLVLGFSPISLILIYVGKSASKKKNIIVMTMMTTMTTIMATTMTTTTIAPMMTTVTHLACANGRDGDLTGDKHLRHNHGITILTKQITTEAERKARSTDTLESAKIF